MPRIINKVAIPTSTIQITTVQTTSTGTIHDYEYPFVLVSDLSGEMMPIQLSIMCSYVSNLLLMFLDLIIV
jgi:hypothetical protein